jgi:hypothetical protein
MNDIYRREERTFLHTLKNAMFLYNSTCFDSREKRFEVLRIKHQSLLFVLRGRLKYCLISLCSTVRL